MRVLLQRVLLRAAVAALAVAPILATAQPAPPAKTTKEAARDLSLGTWVLNRSKSNYRPGPVPLSVVRTYEPHPDGVKVTIETVTERGKTVTEFVAEYDSMEYPVKGSTEIDALSLMSIDLYTAEITLKHGGRDIGFARRVISQDGKTMTMTVSLGDAHNATVRNVAVYDKREP
jgi:hypothetical protein